MLSQNQQQIAKLENEKLNMNTRINEAKKMLELFSVRKFDDAFMTGRVVEGIRKATLRIAEIEQEIKELRKVRL